MSAPLWPSWDVAAEGLGAAQRILACFDYDGTLVPIRPTPEEAVAGAPVREALAALARRPDTDVAVVSGRPLSNLENLVPREGLWLVGHHGLAVRTPAGEETSMIDEAAAHEALEPLRARTREIVAWGEGLRFEDKGAGLALHYRLAASSLAERASEAFREVADALDGFSLLEGKKVLEVRPAGVDKGRAVEALRSRVDGRTAPLYVGDDTTDEDAFRALKAVPEALTVKVGDGVTAARYRVDGPDDVLELLRRLVRLGVD